MAAFPAILGQWQQIVVFISIASMALGAFAAIGQRNIKRLMAYSSIGHMGFALVGLAAGTVSGVQGVAIYMAIYLVMTLGTFAGILAMRVKGGGREHHDLAGWRRSNPAMAFVPRDADVFAGRHSAARGLLRQVVRLRRGDRSQALRLAVIGVLASAVGAYYYLRIVKVMYFDEPRGGLRARFSDPEDRHGRLRIFNVAFWVWPAPLVAAAALAAKSLF